MLDLPDRSEFAVPPSRILLHHPQHGNSFGALSADRLRELNFFQVPDIRALHHEYDLLASSLHSHVETIYLDDVLKDDAGYRAEAASNPNLMFTRDSSITLPWEPGVFIPARLALPRPG